MDHNAVHNFPSVAFAGALGCYFGIGILFAIPFATFGVRKIDPHAAPSGLGFRILIIPGAAFLWPVLLRRWIFKLPPPTERNAHRRP